MIDTHAHLNFSDFKDDLDEIIARSFENGLENIIVVSSSLENSKQSLEVVKKDKRLFAAVGIHPEELESADEFSEIEALAEKEKVVAIGETGLDYFYLSSCHSREGGNLDIADTKKKQKELFIKHIELAEKLDLPLILHNRNSDNDFYEILKDRKVRGVVHCYTGDWNFAQKLLDLGLMISFTGIITFPKTEGIHEAIKNIPLEKIMVETDSPLIAPVPYRGKRAVPWMVKEIVKKIAEIKEISFEEVDEKTSSNAKHFFKI
jgi:TatD DNase family protein